MPESPLHPRHDESGPAPHLSDFALIPRHSGIWEGRWVVADASGNVVDRFVGTLRSEIVGNEWQNELEQRHSSGKIEHQRFVGRPIAPRTLVLESLTSAMSEFDLVVREVGQLLVVELSEKRTGALRGVEFVTLASPDERIRTMQSFRADGSFQGTLTIVERRAASTSVGGPGVQPSPTDAPG